MGTLDSQAALRVMTLFSGAFKGIGFYPASHPAISQPLQELHKVLTGMLGISPEISLGAIDGAIFIGEHLFTSPSTSISDLTNRMQEKSVGRIIFTPGLTYDELQGFVRLFSVKGVGFDTLAENLRQERIVNIRLVRQGEEKLDSQEEGLDAEDDGGDHLVMHGHALKAIRGVCRDIERGRIPNSASVIRVVERMVGITMQEPSILVGLTLIKDYDNYTFNHCVNVGILAMALGASIGLDAISVKSLGIAGELHDIGKTMIPKKILNKPGKLSSVEYDEMKRHSELGAKIVREMEGLDPHIAQIVLGHHMQFNRSGYPEWAQKLPFNQLIDIIAIADTYDAITTLRVYQHPINPRSALNEMQKLSGTFLDDTLVSRFIEMMGKYPVGTLVRLDTNEVGIVYRPNPLDDEAPIVRILFERDGTRLNSPREKPLVGEDGSRYARVVAVVDPHLKNIDVGKFVANGNF